MRAGDIALVWFPHSADSAMPYKLRPVLVLTTPRHRRGIDDAFLLAMITSNERRVYHPGRVDIPITEWKFAGLTKPSAIRMSQVWSTPFDEIQGRIGSVSAETLAVAQARFRSCFSVIS